MAISLEPIKGVIVGSFGQGIVITVVNDDGVPQDISGYDDIYVVGMSPDKRHVVVATDVDYVSDGTDGQIEFEWPENGIKWSGTWTVQAELTIGDPVTEIFKTYQGEMTVGPAIRSS